MTRPPSSTNRFGAMSALAVSSVLTLAVVLAPAGLKGWVLDRADASAILVLVEDAATGPAAADAILIVQWWRSCDSLSITSVPRDLVITPDGRPLAVVHARHGVSASSQAIARQFDIDVAATLTISVDAVAELSGRIGPVTVVLPSASRDLRTGFSGGPGRVELVDEDAAKPWYARWWVWGSVGGGLALVGGTAAAIAVVAVLTGTPTTVGVAAQ